MKLCRICDEPLHEQNTSPSPVPTDDREWCLSCAKEYMGIDFNIKLYGTFSDGIRNKES
jgi:hypothetical protein